MLCDPKEYYPEITDKGVEDLYKLAEIVMNCHYNYVSYTDRDDMTQAAILKAISFIRQNNFDAERSTLKNVLYTAMRNEMKNTQYRQSRDTPVDDEILTGANESKTTVEDSDTYIEIKSLNLPRCKELEKVKSSLNFLGFIIDAAEKKWYPEVERWVALAVWQK